MKSLNKISALGLTLLALGSTPVFAHAGDYVQYGFVNGMKHFVSGFDHIATIIIAGMIIAKVAQNRFHSLIGFGLSASIFAVFHNVAFYGNQGQVEFDCGFMAAAVSLMIATFLVVRNLSLALAKGGNRNDNKR